VSIGHFNPLDPEHMIFIWAVMCVSNLYKLNVKAMTFAQSPGRFCLGVHVPTLDDAVEFYTGLQSLVDRDAKLWTAACKIGPPRGLARFGVQEVVTFYWPSVELHPSQPWGRA
jgi:hypothetical protein